MFGFNKNKVDSSNATIDDELTEEELESVTSISTEDIVTYLSEEETQQIIKSAKSSGEAMRLMNAIVMERKNQKLSIDEYNKGISK